MRRAATLTASILLSATLAVAQTPPAEVSYNDNFQSYGTPANPPGWIDTSIGNPKPTADGLYKTWPEPLDKKSPNIVYGTKQSSGSPTGNNPRIGTFSTLSTKSFSAEGRFEYRGRFIRTSSDTRIGLTFLSSYPTVDRYYLIGLWNNPAPSTTLTLQLFSFGAGTFTGTTNSNVALTPEKWYRFTIVVDDTNNTTRVRARFWLDGEAEPETYSIDASDATASRLKTGRIGMWSAVKGDAYIDDITAKSPVDTSAPDVAIFESGNPMPNNSKFNRNATPEIRVTDNASAVTYTATLDGAPFTSLTTVTTEGWHTLAVHAVDGPGNVTDLQIQFLIDKTPPVLAILENLLPFPPNFFFNRDVIANADVTDISQTTVTATLDGAPYTPGTPITTEGAHTIAMTATDEVGWSSSAGPIAFTIDKTPPVITITSHANGALLDAARAVIAGGSDDAITVVVNDTTATVDPAARTFTTTELPLLEGSNTVVARGTDRAGNIGQASITLNVDTRAPVLAITTPAANVCVDAATLTVSGTFDEARIESIKVNGVTATITGEQWSASIPVEEKNVLITVEAKDVGGHTTSVSRSVTIDRTAPEIEVTSGGSPFTATLVNKAVSLFVRATDADANVSVTSTLDNAPYASGAQIAGEGAHKLVVKATDCAGHVSEKTFDFTVDLTPPTIHDLQPAHASTVGTMPNAIAGITDNDVATVVIDTTSLQATPDASGHFNIAAVPFSEGTNTFTLIATDRAGNRGTLDYSVIVRTNAPAVEIRESGLPIVNGTLYNRAVTPVIRSNDQQATITATLNGNAFTSGTTITADGEYRLHATATDSFGHSASSEVTFTIDRTPPVVQIASPANDAVIRADHVLVTGTAGDATSATINGTPLTLGSGGAFSFDLALDYGANPIVVTGRDRAGNSGNAGITVTRDDAGAGIILTYPPDHSLTNRATTDVVGRLLTVGRATAVRIGTQNVALDPTGAFRVTGYPLVEGDNTITATATAANGVETSATTHVTGDFTPPALTILESNQPLTDGARFATQAVITIDSSDAGGGPVTTELSIDGTTSTPPSAITAAGGHSVIATAHDRAGNQSRAERMLFIGAAGGGADCALSDFDPANNAVVLSNHTTLVGRSGGAIGVKVNGTAAVVGDGGFSANIELPNEGANVITIQCTDANGTATGAPATITLQRVTGEPAINIISPSEGFVSATEIITVTGTISAGVVSADVNGVPATINGSNFTAANVHLSDGLNILTAHGRNAAGRTATASRRGVYEKDLPAITITSPGSTATTGTNRIDVSGTYTNLDPTSIVVTNLSGNQTRSASATRYSDTTGSFVATDVPLVSGEQTLRVSGRDRANREASATVIVRLTAGAPAIVITSPANPSYFPGGSSTFNVSGTFAAAAGSTVDVNGTAATLSGNSYTATATFSTTTITPVVARVTEPGGASATATAFVTQLTDAPRVLETFPAADATEVDSGALLLVLFSQPMDVTTLASGFRLEDSSGAPVNGTLFLDKDVLTFAPGTLLNGGARYTMKVTTAAKNLAGTALASNFTSSFTVASSAPSTPPVVNPIGDAVCGQSISVTGTAGPNARVRLESGALVLTTGADAQGKFTFTYPISGQSGFALVRITVIGSDGSLSPAAELTVRIDCSGPQVLNASFDRTLNKLTINFSEAIDPSTASAGIVLTLTDGSTVSATTSTSQNVVTVTPASDLTQKTFTVTVGTQIEDTTGNKLTTPFSQEFSIGGGSPESGNGTGFISGETYDATTGRPLPGVTIDVDVATPSPITTTTDARGRYLARLPEGAHTIAASRTGYASVWREIIVPAGAGVIPIDIRLTKRGDLQTSTGAAMTLTHGGDTAVTRPVELSIPTISSGTKVSLTAIGAQALTGLLPLGWSPIASAEVHVEGTLSNATLTFVTPPGVVTSAAQNLTAVQYDSARDEWRVLASTVNIANDGRASFPISAAGSYALVYPDKAPGLTPPPLPVAGDVLQGVPAAPADAPELVDRGLELNPSIVLPTGRTVATLRIEGTGAAKFPSGTAVQAYIDEDLRLADGSRLLDPPFATDLLLYRNLTGDLGLADFHLAPSARAAEVVLEVGFDHIRILPYPGRLDRGTLIGSEGGRVPADDKVAVEIPTGAVPEPLRATATSLTTSDLNAIGNVAGFKVVGGFQLTLQRATQPAPQDLDGDGQPDDVPNVELFLAARATYSVETSKLPNANAQVILAEVLDQTPFGRIIRLAAPMMPVDDAAGTPIKRFTTKSIDRSQLPVDGVIREGRYIVLAAEAPIAFATGTVHLLDAQGRLLSDARITAAPLGVQDVTRTTGIYNIPVPARPANPFTLVPRHATTGDGAPYTHATAVDIDAIVRIDLALVPQPPVLGSVVVLKGDPPSQGTLTEGTITRDVALTTNVRASFTPNIDPLSIGDDSITVTDMSNGEKVSGKATADGSVGVVWTLTAGELLKPNNRYNATIAPSIRAANGATLGRASSYTFTTLTQILNTEVRRERIRITIPDAQGVSRISGDPGAIPAGWQAVAVRRYKDFFVRYQGTAAGDGSFSFFIGNGDARDRVGMGDYIDLRLVNTNGALAAIIPLTPFVTEDGRGFVAPIDQSVSFTTPDGIAVEIEAGTFEEPTIVTVNKVPFSAFAEIPSIEAENNYHASIEVKFDGEAKKPIDVSIPVPAGTETAGKQFILAQKGMSVLGPRLAVTDVLRVVNGNFTNNWDGADNNLKVTVLRDGRVGSQQTLTGSNFRRYMQHLMASGIFMVLDIKVPVGGSVGWAVMEGLQASYDIMWSILASYYIPYVHRFEQPGVAIPVLTNVPFTVTGYDPTTGLQAFTRVYDPLPVGEPFSGVPIPPAQQNSGGPYPVFAGPFRVEIVDLDVEDVDITSVPNFKLRLSNGNVRIDSAPPQLDSDTKIEVLNISKGTFASGNAFSVSPLSASVGDRIVILIEKYDVDPSEPVSVVFNESLFTGDSTDEDAVDTFFHDLIKLEYAPEPQGGGAPFFTDITAQARFGTDSAARRLNITLPSALQREAIYRVTLKKEIGDIGSGGEAGLKLGQGTTANEDGTLSPAGGGNDFHLLFHTRKPKGLVSQFTVGDHGTIRGIDKSGNILVAAALDGGLFGYDLSNPAALQGSGNPIASILGPPEGPYQYLSVTIDRHNRIWTTAHQPIVGLIRSYRLEDVANGTLDTVKGKASSIINWKLGYSSMIGLPSNTILSDVPESIPFRVRVILQDDEKNFDNRALFKAGTSASVTQTYPADDIERLRVSAGFDGSMKYKYQRVTVENITLDMRWSADATPAGPAIIDNIIARSTDRMRIIRNKRTYAVVAHLGYGVGVYDANAMESNRYPGNTEHLREKLVLTAGKVARECQFQPPTWGIGENYIVTDIAMRGDDDNTGLYVYAVHPYFGVLDLHLKLPSDTEAGTRDDDCDQRGPGGGFALRTSPPGNEPARMTALAAAIQAAGGTPYPHFSQLDMYHWHLDGGEANKNGERNSVPYSPVDRDYLLIPAMDYGLIIAEVGGDPPTAPYFPLKNENIADVIWIPSGAMAVRVYQKSNVAVVTDRAGRVVLVDLSRIDERYDEEGNEISGLFPTVKKALAGSSSDPYGVGSDDPRIIWKSEPGLVSGILAPVFDPDTGFVFAGAMVARQMKVVSAIDPRIAVKANLGSEYGLDDVGGIVPLGIALPPEIQKEFDALPACAPPREFACKENASLGAFRVELSLPGNIGNEIAGGEVQVAVESERVAGAITEQTPDGFPRAHLRRKRRDGSSETSNRAASNFKLKRIAPDDMTSVLKSQSGYNRFVSPWIVAIADPRASRDYSWNGADAQKKKEAGCEQCERPKHLKNLDEGDGVYELWTNGRFIAVRPELSGFSDSTIFDMTKYDYLGERDRLKARVSTIMADTVRPTEVLVPAQNAPMANGMLQETVFVHSGEVQSNVLDLDAGGRAEFNVLFDRVYRSRTIGGTVFGQGWDSRLLRRLRALPNGDVEYRDGGDVWRFTAVPKEGKYTAPKGLFLKLARTERGWKMVDQKWRITEFDDLGRVLYETDEFYDPSKPGSGNVNRYVYDQTGRLTHIVDAVQRVSELRYFSESDAGSQGAYPGLLREIEDWRDRKINFSYDSSNGTLTKVELPNVPNTSGGRPAVKYAYTPTGGGYSDSIELRNLFSITDPHEALTGGAARVEFTYGTGGAQRDHLLSQKWGTGETATFTYNGPTSVATKDVLGQTRDYTLTEQPKDYITDRAHVQTLIEHAVPVFNAPFGQLPSSITADPPSTTSAERTYGFSYDEHGLMQSATLNGVRSMTYGYKNVQPEAPGYVANSITTNSQGGSSESITKTITYGAGAGASTSPQSVSANGKTVNTPEPRRNAPTITAQNNLTSMLAQCRSDALMEVLEMSGGTGGGTPGGGGGGLKVRRKFAPANDAAQYRRALLMEVDQSGLKTNMEYPSEDQMITRDERGTVTTTDYDAQRRVLRMRVEGGEASDDESYQYDASGRMRVMTRKQGDKTVTTTYSYDVMGRMTSQVTDNVANGGGSVSSVFDVTGRTIITTHAGGAVTTTRLDTLGRVVSETTTTGTSSPIEDFYAYDLDDNLVFHSDRHDASALAYDGHGRLVATMKLDGTKSIMTNDSWGRPTEITETDSNGGTVRRSTYEYTDAGRMKSMDRRIDGSQSIKTTFDWDGAMRTTGIAEGDRANTMKFDDAGRLMSATSPFETTQVTGHDGALPATMTKQENGGGAYQLAMQYNAHSQAVTQSLGGLQWEQHTDQAGNVTSSSEPNQPATTYEYDARGSLLNQNLPGGGQNAYTYHPSGGKTSYTDPSSETTQTETDLVGRPVKVTYKDGTTEIIEYEGRRVKSLTDRRGRKFVFGYNNKGLVTSISDGTGNVLDELDYDAAGHLTRWKNEDAAVEFADFNLDDKPATTVQTRYRNGAIVDRYEQKHEWDKYGERVRWTMPAYGGMSPGGTWTKSVEQAFDAAGNIEQIRRLTWGGNTSVLLSATYRNAGRPNRRTVGTTAGKTIMREYTYDSSTGQLRRLEVTSNGTLVAGASVTYQGLLRVVAQLLGVSGGARTDSWSYDGRSRLETSRLGYDDESTPARDELTLGDFRTALTRTKVSPVDPPTITYSESAEGGHKIATMTYGSTLESFNFVGGERTQDGRFVYEYDTRGRMVSVTQKALSGALTVRRVLYDYDGHDRLVGRRAEYADVSNGTVGTWKLEDRPTVIAYDALPADTTFVWDPISDRLVSIFRAGSTANIDGNGGLVRQIIHGGLGLDDPIEVTAADPLALTGGATHFYPVYDEAGAGSLQVVLNENGEIVSRNVPAGPYGEDQAVLLGGAVDRVGVKKTTDEQGNVTIVVTLRSTEAINPATLTAGLQISVVTSSGQTVRVSGKVPVLVDPMTAQWTFTEAEWNALIDASPAVMKIRTNGVETTATVTPSALSIAVTDQLRSSSWSATQPLLQAPAWAVATKPVFASAAKPVEVREALSNLATLATDDANVLYNAPNLISLASARGGASDPARMIVAAAFHAHPFQEPATGINFVRSRWFDTRSGVWLTPDPAGYNDSPNLYAYAGGDPVNHRDPTGMYEADMHFGITKFLALRAGFSTRDAQTIAYNAQLPDLLTDTDPIITTVRYFRDIIEEKKARLRFDPGTADEYKRSAEMRFSCLRLLHFPRHPDNEKLVAPNTAEAQQLSRAGIEANNLKLFGLGLHPLEDSYAHMGIPSLPGAIAGHPDEHGGWRSHQADQPQYRPRLAIDAARTTYNMMLDFRSKNGGTDFSGPPADWAVVEAELNEFVYLQNISEKRMWLAKHNVSMPDSYWHDVTPGPKDQEGLSDWQKQKRDIESTLELVKKVWDNL